MTKIKAISSVYAYYFPEVRAVVDKTIKHFSQSLLLTSIFPGLDDYHLSFIRKFVSHSSSYQKGLDRFPYQYFVNGSSEGIFHLLQEAIFHNSGKPIYVFKGEYEGYREYGKNMGKTVTEIDFHADIKKLPLGRWFISNPSAIDGNLIKNKDIRYLCNLGHEVILDLAYLGTTRRYQIDLTHKNIIAVLASMSKPFGLFYYRLGIVFSRQPLPTLAPNKWFKNILSLTIGEAILDRLGLGSLYQKYLPLQKKAIKELIQETGAKVRPSDVLLLANLQDEGLSADQKLLLQKYRRHDNYRFCLTPYFLSDEES